jgi:transcriptional regulator with XRE-family HTH domain
MSTLPPPSPPRRGFAVEVGARIKQIRRHRQFQQRDLASRANLGQDMLSKYESGVHVPSLKRAWALARGLSVPVDLFLPVFDMPEPVDRELYQQFRKIWLQPLPVRALTLQSLKLVIAMLQSPLCLPNGEPHAPRR